MTVDKSQGHFYYCPGTLDPIATWSIFPETIAQTTTLHYCITFCMAHLPHAMLPPWFHLAFLQPIRHPTTFHQPECLPTCHNIRLTRAEARLSKLLRELALAMRAE